MFSTSPTTTTRHQIGKMTTISKQERVKSFHITNWSLNTPEVYEKYQKLIQFIAWGEERTALNGKEHHQVFMVLKKATTNSPNCIKRISSWFGNAHVEVVKGSLQQNIDYINKEGVFHERGIKPVQGKRTDLESLTRAIMDGETTMDEIMIEHPYFHHQFKNHLQAVSVKYLKKVQKTKVGVARKGIWYYGPTSAGKSWRAFNKPYPYLAFDTHYQKSLDQYWWDNYKNQQTVVIDEFRRDNKAGIKYSNLLSLVDETSAVVPLKYVDAYPMMSERIVITCNRHPKEVFKEDLKTEDFAQFERRFFIVKVVDRETEVIENVPEFFDNLYEPHEMEIFNRNNKGKKSKKSNKRKAIEKEKLDELKALPGYDLFQELLTKAQSSSKKSNVLMMDTFKGATTIA